MLQIKTIFFLLVCLLFRFQLILIFRIHHSHCVAHQECYICFLEFIYAHKEQKCSVRFVTVKAKNNNFKRKLKKDIEMRASKNDEAEKKGTHTAPYFYRITKPKNVNNKVCSDIEDVHYWF